MYSDGKYYTKHLIYENLKFKTRRVYKLEKKCHDEENESAVNTPLKCTLYT